MSGDSKILNFKELPSAVSNLLSCWLKAGAAMAGKQSAFRFATR